ncbi:cyclic pyranopterin monophosphate synthase MoaC [bacterium]|nr:cyclic pyranopterin monophosphate synthase MoaC [bacterium]
MTERKLTHLNEVGEVHMVGVDGKPTTARLAVAEGCLYAAPETLDLLEGGKKGDAIAVSRVAGIMAAKRTSELIPLCHPIATTSVAVDMERRSDPSSVVVTATVTVVERTGAEMEALTAVSVALLTLYDMLKSAQKDMRIGDIRLRRKTGGKSGDLELP